MNNVTRSVFQDLFEQRLRLLNNDVCARCDAQVRHPLLPWIVGSRFKESAERVLFVGKPHTGEPGKRLPSGIIDPTEMVANVLWDKGNKGSAYWGYTRDIAERIYGANAADFLALSNLVKCTSVAENASSSADATSKIMAQCCIGELGVIWKEVEQLQPRTIVFYTYSFFRALLRPIPIALEGTVREITSEGHSKPCRNKRLGWWERQCDTSWTENLRLLVVGHPERKARPEFVELLANWIRPSAVQT
jgi:hypothetical protein